MIPETKQPAVERALQETFETSELDDILPLTAGLSTALVLRVVVRGRPYVLRVITQTDAMNDPTRQFAAMRSAADAGLAPRVWYTSVEDRISITDFVEARPIPIGEATELLAATIRKLHALPPFGKMWSSSYFDVVDGFVRRFQEAKLLPERATEELFRGYARMAELYPRLDPELVSSHNDLKPENVLFDGDRFWFVDWEAAFLNDRYADLAVVANWVVRHEADEEDFLRTYFGQTADEYRRARFYFMRQLMHMFYTVVFLRIAATAGEALDPDTETPNFRDFHDRIWAGDVTMVSAEMKGVYGLVHMKQLLQNMRSDRFEDALRVVSNRPT